MSAIELLLEVIGAVFEFLSDLLGFFGMMISTFIILGILMAFLMVFGTIYFLWWAPHHLHFYIH